MSIFFNPLNPISVPYRCRAIHWRVVNLPGATPLKKPDPRSPRRRGPQQEWWLVHLPATCLNVSSLILCRTPRLPWAHECNIPIVSEDTASSWSSLTSDSFNLSTSLWHNIPWTLVRGAMIQMSRLWLSTLKTLILCALAVSFCVHHQPLQKEASLGRTKSYSYILPNLIICFH